MAESKASSSQILYEKLEKLIKGDAYKLGDRLPTEMEICELFGVGRSTVREAVRMLQVKGYVQVKRGSGTYIEAKSAKNDDSAWLLDNKEKLHDYMDVRIAIEVLSVRLFIKRSSEEKIRQLEILLFDFEKAVDEEDIQKMSELDERFHGVIAEGTENELLINITQLLADSFRQYRDLTFANRSTRHLAVVAHKKILDSIKRRDTNDAVYNIQQHLTESVEEAVQ